MISRSKLTAAHLLLAAIGVLIAAYSFVLVYRRPAPAAVSNSLAKVLPTTAAGRPPAVSAEISIQIIDPVYLGHEGFLPGDLESAMEKFYSTHEQCTLQQLQQILVTNQAGKVVPIRDLADVGVRFKQSK